MFVYKSIGCIVSFAIALKCQYEEVTKPMECFHYINENNVVYHGVAWA